jgi:hypothetical protein
VLLRLVDEAARIAPHTPDLGCRPWAVRDSNPRPLARHGQSGSSMRCATESPNRTITPDVRDVSAAG